MGYTIRVGNAVVESHWPKEDDEYRDDPSARWYVHLHKEEAAPYSSDSHKSNDRSPSYTAWADFAHDVGLYEWFFDKGTGKMREHPGCMALTKADAAFITDTLARYKAAHPQAEATICACKQCDVFMAHAGNKDHVFPPHNPNADMHLVRLTWLEWWVRWAVANCERPAIYNS